MDETNPNREGLLWWASWAVITGSIGLIMIAPRPTPPTQGLGLQYDLGAAAQILKKDTARAADSKLGEPAARAIALFYNVNLSELGRMPPGWDRDGERTELREIGSTLRGDEEQLRDLQARYASDAIAAILGDKSTEDAEKILGAAIEKLRRYKLASGRHLRAPEFVLRTFFKARLNQALGISPVASFSVDERLAHFGWPAFHAVDTPPVQRAMMLDQYQELGGQYAQPTRGHLLLLAQAAAKSAAVYESLHAQSSNLRYRNHALFVEQSVRQQQDD